MDNATGQSGQRDVFKMDWTTPLDRQQEGRSLEWNRQGHWTERVKEGVDRMRPLGRKGGGGGVLNGPDEATGQIVRGKEFRIDRIRPLDRQEEGGSLESTL